MRVVADDDALRLDDADDTGSFAVVSSGGADAAAAVLSAAAAGGAADAPGHVLVAIDAVRRLADGHVDDRWADRFAAMLDYARGKGWLSEDGRSILAHVESPQGAER